MSKTPLVSVILPVFNGENHIERSLRSLLEQTLHDIQIITVNDGSSDRTQSIIENFSHLDNRILPINLPKNCGVHEARLAGLRHASGEWVGFLDADDFARTDMFNLMHNVATAHNVDIVVCGSYRVTTERKIISTKLRFRKSQRVSSHVFERFSRFEFGTGSLCNKLYRRDIILPYADMHFPWRQNINEDLLLNIACFYQAKSVYLCKEILHEYVLNKSSVTSNTTNAKAYVDTYRAAALAVSFFSEIGDQPLAAVIDLYRTQLSWGNYQIGDIATIMPYEEELKEAVDLINRVKPSALALLAARKDSPIVGTRLAVKSLFYRLFMIFGLR